MIVPLFVPLLPLVIVAQLAPEEADQLIEPPPVLVTLKLVLPDVFETLGLVGVTLSVGVVSCFVILRTGVAHGPGEPPTEKVLADQ